MGEKELSFHLMAIPCVFLHVLLNTLDMNDRGDDVRLIIEGSATRLIKKIAEADNPLSEIYKKVKKAGLIDCVYQAGFAKMGSLKTVGAQGLSIWHDMGGHSGMAKYMD